MSFTIHRAMAIGLLALIPFCGCSQPDSEEGSVPEETQIENLRAFAKLYGYARFFHPSDEASRIDWGRFAVLGAARVRDASDSGELRQALESLFLPLAPTIQIYEAAGPAPALPEYGYADGEDRVILAWQHRGVDLGSSGIYQSARSHRSAMLNPQSEGFGTVTQGLPALKVRGLEIRLSAAVRAEPGMAAHGGQLWLRVDRPEGKRGFFDNMGDRPVTSATWSRYEITGTVAGDAESIYFGCLLAGEGKVWVDAFLLEAREPGGTWQALTLGNPGFEAGDDVEGWHTSSPGYSYDIESSGVFAGNRCLRIAAGAPASAAPLGAAPLFDPLPELGEVTDEAIGRGLRARVPLALSGLPEELLDDASPAPMEALLVELDALDAGRLDASNTALRLGGVIIAWNVLQHFYPYFDLLDVDWDAALDQALAEALASEDGDAYLATLRRLVVKLQDGHGRVQDPAMWEDKAWPPFLVDWIEDEVVVTRVLGMDELAVGDVIVALDGVPAREIVAMDELLISGSPQWKRARAMGVFGMGEKGTRVRLQLRRGGDTRELELPRNRKAGTPPKSGEDIRELAGGVFYVDLTRAKMPAIAERIEELAAAPGIIFDLRGYPQGNHDILRHLSDRPLQSAHWLVPQSIYPDRARPVGYDRLQRWRLLPSEPRLGGRIAFLTDASAISYAESVMGIVEYYGLGEIVGATTAGANGNVNIIYLPGGYQVAWTGMRVEKHDGSQHHLVGIQPTLPVQPTIQGIREGRDEQLEAALTVVLDTR